MKKIEFTKQQAYIILETLENKPDGYSIKQLRCLQRVGESVDKNIKEYREKIRELVHLFNNTPDLQYKIAELNQVIGNQKDIYNFDDSDVEFLKELWSNLQGFVGRNEIRKVILEIMDILNST